MVGTWGAGQKASAMFLAGNFARGTVLLYMGEMVSANQHQEKALAVFDPRQPLPPDLAVYRVGALHFLSLGLSGLGYPDRAWAKSREMLEAAQQSSNPMVLTNAFSYAVFHNLVRGEGTVAQKQAEEAMALAEEMGLVSLSAQTIARHSAALIAQGRYEEGISGMRRGISAIHATGGTPLAWYLRVLAEGLGKAVSAIM